MKAYMQRIFQLLCGLFLLALAIVFTLKANIGYGPWEVFHAGVATQSGMSIGTASIITGLVILLFVVFCKEKIGIGTIANMILVGYFIDFILNINLIPIAPNYFLGILMLLIGFLILSFGSYFYINSAFGSGPRDSLMVALNRKTKLPIGICRTSIELSATILGWLLGGKVGLGTLISIVGLGFFVQLVFSIMKFDAAKVKHQSLKDDYQNMFHKK